MSLFDYCNQLLAGESLIYKFTSEPPRFHEPPKTKQDGLYRGKVATKRLEKTASELKLFTVGELHKRSLCSRNSARNWAQRNEGRLLKRQALVPARGGTAILWAWAAEDEVTR